MEIKEAILDIELSMVKDFLASFDLRYESDIDKTLYIEEIISAFVPFSLREYLLIISP